MAVWEPSVRIFLRKSQSFRVVQPQPADTLRLRFRVFSCQLPGGNVHLPWIKKYRRVKYKYRYKDKQKHSNKYKYKQWPADTFELLFRVEAARYLVGMSSTKKN